MGNEQNLTPVQQRLVIAGERDAKGEPVVTVNGAQPLLIDRAKQLCPRSHTADWGTRKEAALLLAVAILCEYLPDEAGTPKAYADLGRSQRQWHSRPSSTRESSETGNMIGHGD